MRETTEFGARRGEFDAINTKVVGVSVDRPDRQKKHAIQCAANFPILSDADKRLTSQLGILKDTGTSARTTYLIGRDGIARRIFNDVKVSGHVDQVLKAAKDLQA